MAEHDSPSNCRFPLADPLITRSAIQSPETLRHDHVRVDSAIVRRAGAEQPIDASLDVGARRATDRRVPDQREVRNLRPRVADDRRGQKQSERRTHDPADGPLALVRSLAVRHPGHDYTLSKHAKSPMNPGQEICAGAKRIAELAGLTWVGPSMKPLEPTIPEPQKTLETRFLLDRLVIRSRAGDVGATRDLLREVAPVVRRTCKSVLRGTHADLEDTIQESLVAFIRALPSYRFDGSISHYARRIAFRASLCHRRRSLRWRDRFPLTGNIEDAAAGFSSSPSEGPAW